MATLDLTNIKNYVNANTDILVSKLVAGTESAKIFNIQNGVTTDTAIHGVITSLSIQDGASCGFNAQGTQAITARTLEPNFLKVNQEYCAKDFYGTYKHYETKVAMGKSPLPLEEALIEDVVKSIAIENEKLLWRGKKASGDLVDGITTIIAGDNAIPSANKFTSTKTTVLERLNEMYAKVGNKKVVAFISSAMYRQMITEVIEKNFYASFQDDADLTLQKFILPGTNFVVYGVDGIADTDTNIYGLVPEEVFIGCDNADDASAFDFYWSSDDRVYKLVIEWVLTVNYMFSENVYVFSV